MSFSHVHIYCDSLKELEEPPGDGEDHMDLGRLPSPRVGQSTCSFSRRHMLASLDVLAVLASKQVQVLGDHVAGYAPMLHGAMCCVVCHLNSHPIYGQVGL